MKKILLATSMLAATTGFAAAEVTLSGDARMGIISDFGGGDTAFTSRARVKFSMVGTTDGGIEFGASFRADNAGGAASGTAGSVYASANGFKISMGDVDGAANAAVGQVSGVGLTGLGDRNEVTYYANGGSNGTSDPSVLVEYSAGAVTGYFSITNPGGDETFDAADAYALGVKYSTDVFSVALGYEMLDGQVGGVVDDPATVPNEAVLPALTDLDSIILGASYTFGAATLKARYGQADGTLAGAAVDGDQWALSVDYAMGATTVTAFYADDSELGGTEAYGLGASYDLGGGASIVGGYVKDKTADDSAFDLGISMSF